MLLPSSFSDYYDYSFILPLSVVFFLVLHVSLLVIIISLMLLDSVPAFDVVAVAVAVAVAIAAAAAAAAAAAVAAAAPTATAAVVDVVDVVITTTTPHENSPTWPRAPRPWAA